MEAIFAAAMVAYPLIGLLVGRWWVLLLPLIVVPLQFLGTAEGWWGNGLGDAAGAAMMLALAFGLGITAAAVFLRRIVFARGRRP